jgi:hypothetical protein
LCPTGGVHAGGSKHRSGAFVRSEILVGGRGGFDLGYGNAGGRDSDSGQVRTASARWCYAMERETILLSGSIAIPCRIFGTFR